MNLQRFKEPSFVTGAVSCVLLLVLLFSRGNSTPRVPLPISPNVDVVPHLDELRAGIEKSNARIAQLEKSLFDLRNLLSDSPAPDAVDDTIELHTKADAEKRFQELGDTPSAEKLADCLGQIDTWIATPDDRDALQEFKVQQVDKLRLTIKKELTNLHDKALKAETGIKASEFHAMASQILALYPMDTSANVLNEARQLSSRHADVGVRIDVIRRQRYNSWAMTRIEKTINDINSIATSFKTSDNPKTIAATVRNLGEVDPLLLEPAVAQLYNYAVEQAKSNVNSEQQLELGKQLIEPSIKRKSYGDF